MTPAAGQSTGRAAGRAAARAATDTSSDTSATLDAQSIAAIRGIAMDAPHAARSGHQGTAMALAPVAHVLWHRIMVYDPKQPDWPDRDRFVLSCGHASALLYAMLHLSGYDLSLSNLKAFRQLGSPTAGHPEAGHVPGVEVTTGPLGQGFANAVGMGIAESWLRHRFSPELCDHHIYVLCSDGDLAEGVSHEAASLAGHLGLGRLIYIYDDNRISIDGETHSWLSDDAIGRFESYGWHTRQLGEAGEELDALESAITEAREVADAPSLLVLRTHIAHPSPDLLDQPAAHGYALFDDEIARAKDILGIPAGETFWVPDEVRGHYGSAAERGQQARQEWEQRLADAECGGDADRDRASQFKATLAGSYPDDWHQDLSFDAGESLATRQASAQCLNQLAARVPGVLAGGADLTGNTGTKLGEAQLLSRDCPDGQQIYYGVREHAMGSAMVGMARHGGVLPVGGTFLVFSDYMRPAVRLAALSCAKAVFVWSHDSVAVGEDGPTHQPVEHLAALRAIPNLSVIRPADANETVGAWTAALANDGPTALILTRQGVPILEQTRADEVLRGAYVLEQGAAGDAAGNSPAAGDSPAAGNSPGAGNSPADLILIGTGSEVGLCLEAAQMLAQRDIRTQVVSMPSWDLFERQPAAYQQDVLPPGVPKISVEAASTQGWHRWADHALGIDQFGASAPGAEVMAARGMTPQAVCDQAADWLRTRTQNTT